MVFHIVALQNTHDRKGFRSGEKLLDHYFHQQVMQDSRRKVTACFVLLQDQKIAGYYTLASASVPLTDLPIEMKKKLPRYPSVPAVRMGRLAVDQDFQGQGLGGILLADALMRASHSDIASYALIVDAKNKKAAAFYQYHGFIALPQFPLILFLPLATAKKIK